MKINDSKIPDTIYRRLIKRYVETIIDVFSDDILAVTLFGSVARRTATNESDIDMLILVKKRTEELHKKFLKIDIESYDWQENQELLDKKIYTKIYEIIKTEEELRRNPLILLDILDHGIILYDPQEKMKNLLSDLDKKLKELGAKKIVFEDGKWCWDLKPDWKPGEIVEIKL